MSNLSRALIGLLAALAGPALAQTPAAPAPAEPAPAPAEPAPAPAEPAPAPAAAESAEPPAEASPAASAETATPLQIIPGPDRVFIDRVSAAEGGFTGLDRLATATIGPLGTLRLRAGVTHFEALDFPVDEATNIYTATEFALSGTPVSFAEVTFGVRATSNANDASLPRVLQSVGDATFGLKLGWTFFDTLSAAATVEAQLVGLVGGGGLASDGTSYRWRGVLTGDFHRGFDIPARLTFALGYDVENREALFADELQEPGVVTEWGLQAYRYDRVMAALGLEIPMHRFGGVFVEYHIGTPLQVELTRRGPGSNDFTFDVVPHWVTPGLRAFPVPELAVDFALRYGLSDSVYTGVPATPPWALQIALTYTLDPRPEVTEREVVREVKPPPLARVGGTVVDGGTQAPIAGAIIEFGAGLSPQLTGPDGRFVGYRLERGGPMTLRARAEGYQPADADIEVSPGGEVQVPFALTAAPPPPPGAVEVRVVDADGDALPADVRVLAADGPSGRATDGRAFRAELPAGRYVVAAKGEGGVGEQTVSVAAGQTATVKMTLAAVEGAEAGKKTRKRAKKTPTKAARSAAKGRKRARPAAGSAAKTPATRGRRARFPTIRFTSGKARLSGAAKSALDGVARTLKARKGLRVRIAAYTDNRGSPAELDRLSNQRARAVKDYLMSKGIEGRRLSARGYGKSKPVAPNLTASGRARNNRVEFRVLGGK